MIYIFSEKGRVYVGNDDNNIPFYKKILYNTILFLTPILPVSIKNSDLYYDAYIMKFNKYYYKHYFYADDMDIYLFVFTYDRILDGEYYYRKVHSNGNYSWFCQSVPGHFIITENDISGNIITRPEFSTYNTESIEFCENIMYSKILNKL